MRNAFFALVALLVVAVLALLVFSSGTAVAVDPAQGNIVGNQTPFTVQAANPHGIRRVTAVIEQNGRQYQVLDTSRPAHRLFFLGKRQAPETVRFMVGRQAAPGLAEGKATVIVTATGNDFRGSSGRVEWPVEVNSQPPRVVADGFQHYINQGGAELVTFTVSGYWTEAGVRVGPFTFRSFPMPGRPENERFSFFALPWNAPLDTVPVVYARNPSGAEARANFWYKVFPKRFETHDFPLDEKLMERLVNQVDPAGSGDMVARFLKINGELRRANNKVLSDLRFKTEQRVLWSGPFLRYGKTESSFADTRNYIYQGKKIDQQTHLGFDLADLQHSPVRAANDGKVVWAAELGIYGNCVVVDHGYGLQTIYGHMSQIDVKPGDLVTKGQIMGKSGSTGLAGGDHIHFSMQIDGVQITPVEWWDEHWIHDRILSKIPAKAEGEAAAK